jgi:hypothetical protein
MNGQKTSGIESESSTTQDRVHLPMITPQSFIWIYGRDSAVSGKWYNIEVIQCTETADNWIAPGLVEKWKDNIVPCQSTKLLVYQGETSPSTEKITLTWIGRDKFITRQCDFIVASKKFSFNILVGKGFLELFGSDVFFAGRGERPPKLPVS